MKKINTLLIIATVGLFVASLIFILVEIFSDSTSDWLFHASMICVILGNIFNFVRTTLNKSK